MSDDDLDDLFDLIDEDDLGAVPAAMATAAASPAADLNVSGEEKLRLELEEMKKKMAQMEQMLKQQSFNSAQPATPPKAKHTVSSRVNPTPVPARSSLTHPAKKPIPAPTLPTKKPAPTPKKEPSPPKKLSLADTFKTVTSPTAPSTNISPRPCSSSSNVLPQPLMSTPSRSNPSNSFSDTFSTALDDSMKLQMQKKVGAKPIQDPVQALSQSDKIDKCPHSGLRIVNRSTAKSDFNCAVATRKFIKIPHLPLHFKDKQDVAGDWVTSGVIVRKTGPMKSKTGNDFSIWTLSDLVSMDNVISLFMFKDSHTEHRKEQVGTVVSLLNPNFMPPRDQEKGKKTELAFSLDMPRKLLRMGMAYDYGTCRNTTKSGQKCNNFINKALTQHCDFHIIKVHAKLRNKRMALSGSYTPQPPGANKVQQSRQECQAFTHKGNVYYPNAKPAQSAAGVNSQDKPEVAALKKKGMMISSSLISSGEFKDRLKIQSPGSIQLKRALEGASQKKAEEESQKSKRLKLDTPSTSGKSFLKKHVETPKLGGGQASGGFIDLNFSKKKVVCKNKALLLAKKGDFCKHDPRKKRHQLTESERKNMAERSLGLEKVPARQEEILNGPSDMLYFNPIVNKRPSNMNPQNKENKSSRNKKSPEPPKSRSKLSAAFGSIDPNSIKGKQLMKAESMNAGTLKEKEMERTTDYFNAMEKFEYNEEKLMSIKEMKVSVYVCKICNTATQKQQPKCIEANHLVKKAPAVKRFFACKGCKQRTDVVGLPFPEHPCRKCGKSAWEKCSMYHEKKGPKLQSEKLVVRGEDVEVHERVK